MFLVVDLSKPRKYITEKYDDIMLDYKLNPPKINKPLVTAAVMGIIILAVGTTAQAAPVIDPGQFAYLVKHYVEELHYPKELAEKILQTLSKQDITELYARVQHQDAFREQIQPLLNASYKVTDKLVHLIRAIVKASLM